MYNPLGILNTFIKLNKGEQIQRMFVFPLLYKIKFKHNKESADKALKQLYADSKAINIDLPYLLIKGFKKEYDFPEFIKYHYLEFMEVIQYLNRPIDNMDIPQSFINKAKEYSKNK